MRDCPNFKAKAKEISQDHHDGLNPSAPKKSRFYAFLDNKRANPERKPW